MIRFFKLLNFELNRFMKIYVGLLVITLIIQLTGIIVMAKGYINSATKVIYEGGISQSSYIEQYGTIDMSRFLNSLWFMGPLAICVAGLMFYIFLIWYRDWFGKNTFIYRLLMLPTTRLNLLFSKAIAIMIMVMGLVSFQLLLLPLESTILKWIVPKFFREDIKVLELISNNKYLQLIVPQTFLEFVLYYGVGLMFVLVMFTAILFERSYKIKGILFGAVYIGFSFILFFLPVWTQIRLDNLYLYPSELLYIEIVMGLIVIMLSSWLSGFLLKNKVTV